MIRKTTRSLLLAVLVSACGGLESRGSLPVAPVSDLRDQAPMMLVSVGHFIRGGSGGGPGKARFGMRKKKDDSMPVRRIYLNTYRIDKNEVTNAAYGRFVAAVGHPSPGLARGGKSWGGSWGRFDWHGRRPPPGASDLPVTLVTWFDAEAYCTWAGKRLPTEAEWEKAARGPGGNIYPWGGGASPGAANFGGRHEGPLPGGSFSLDKSPYGVMDLAGNVAEWVNDYYHSTYYAKSPARNPRGPRRGSRRVIRGGYWSQKADQRRLDWRWSGVPSEKHGGVGFRCALSGEAGR